MDEIDSKKDSDQPDGPPDWLYQCQICGNLFTMPAPKGPADEKGRHCPNCRSENIERTNICDFQACPPGG